MLHLLLLFQIIYVFYETGGRSQETHCIDIACEESRNKNHFLPALGCTLCFLYVQLAGFSFFRMGPYDRGSNASHFGVVLSCCALATAIEV